MNEKLNDNQILYQIIDTLSLREYPDAINALSSFSTQLAMIPQNDISITSVNALWAATTGILLSSYSVNNNQVKIKK